MIERMLMLPDGIMLVTGPTGSGKTTTLYSCLNYINRPDRKIITVEDPVEYQMAGINQVQVNADIGMTFPAALRSMLRQAPNIIMIGEIRDYETASIAINASPHGPPRVFAPCTPTMRPGPWRVWWTWASSRSWWRPRSAPSWPSGWCASFATTASIPAS